MADEDLHWRRRYERGSQLPLDTVGVSACVGLLEFSVFVENHTDPHDEDRPRAFVTYSIEGYLDETDMEAGRTSNSVSLPREDFLAALQLAVVREKDAR